MDSPAPAAARPHNLGEAIERLRGKWGAIVAFGALLILLGAVSIVADNFEGLSSYLAGIQRLGMVGDRLPKPG